MKHFAPQKIFGPLQSFGLATALCWGVHLLLAASGTAQSYLLIYFACSLYFVSKYFKAN